MISCTAFVRGTALPLLVLLAALAVGPGAIVSPVSAEPILIGLYPPGPLESPPVVDTIVDVDNWLASVGKRVTIAGAFVTVEDNPFYVPLALETPWSRGYVPYINIKSLHGTQDIANGLVNDAIRAWAVQFAIWASGGKRAFLAPLPEMNGGWNPYYYCSPPSLVPCGGSVFKAAYQKIRQIFSEEMVIRGVPASAVRWVFAPNGWGDAFENYYPGPALADIVATNGFNFGGCPTQPDARVWDFFNTALKPFVDRLGVMAPGTPIFISETGTVDVLANGVGDKNIWLQDLFTKLTTIPNFRGILYLNTSEIRSTLNQCPLGADYRLHVPGSDFWLGFKNTIAGLPNYVYWAPDGPEMRQFFGGVTPRRNRDFNGDGTTDILWQNTSSGNIALWFMSGNGTVLSGVGLGSAAGWTPTVGDFNGDGIADILWQHAAGNATLWLMNANGTVQTAIGLGNLGGWTPSVGDFNGDGIADILWQHSAGNVAVWLMNANGTVQTAIGLGNLAGWTPSVGDFNGDGKADLLWQNTASGNAALWLMNGATVAQSLGLGNTAGWTPK